MFDLFYSLPGIVIGAIAAIVAFVAVAIVPRMLRPLVHLERDPGLNDFVGRAQNTVITLLAVVLGLSLINGQNALRHAEFAVSTEAGQINQRDRLLTRYGDPKVAMLRTALLNSTQSIVADEWPLLAGGQSSDKTSQFFTEISRGVLAIEPGAGRQVTIYGEILKLFDEIADSRQRRRNTAIYVLPEVFWEIFSTLFLLLVVLSVLIEPTRGRTLAIGGQAIAVALLLTLVVMFDHPFGGETAVKPDSFARTIALMQGRTS